MYHTLYIDWNIKKAKNKVFYLLKLEAVPDNLAMGYKYRVTR